MSLGLTSRSAESPAGDSAEEQEQKDLLDTTALPVNICSFNQPREQQASESSVFSTTLTLIRSTAGQSVRVQTFY